MREWLQKIIVRKVLLNLAKLGTSYWIAHQGWLVSHLPFINGLDQIKINPETLADSMAG